MVVDKEMGMHIAEWINTARACLVEEAEDFLRQKRLLPPGKTLQDLQKGWEQFVLNHFDKNNPDGFYRNWVDEAGAMNIAANIFDQFSRIYVVGALNVIFGQPYSFAGRILDFGCGTAAISSCWQRSFAPSAELLLADVENLSREFIRYQCKKYPEYKVLLTEVTLDDVPDNSFDLVLCIDVLEHLRSPSKTFFLLDQKLRYGGFLLLQAPWGGHPEHLEEAPQDWQTSGGKSALHTRYLQLAKMNDALDTSGLYIKNSAAKTSVLCMTMRKRL